MGYKPAMQSGGAALTTAWSALKQDPTSLGRAEKREHSPSREHRENMSYRLGKWEYDHGLGLEFRFPVSLPPYILHAKRLRF